MKIIISNNAGIPIYEQIKEQIKSAILQDIIEEGEALPSIRQLARDLKISVITTTRAYNDLEQEGFIANVQGKGCFVQPKNSELIQEHALKETETALLSAISSARIAKISKKELITVLDILSKEENYE